MFLWNHFGKSNCYPKYICFAASIYLFYLYDYYLQNNNVPVLPRIKWTLSQVSIFS